ncbi:MAG: cytochrome c peroxidase [Bacteroidota bacterium]
MHVRFAPYLFCCFILNSLLFSCQPDGPLIGAPEITDPGNPIDGGDPDDPAVSAVEATFAGRINLDDPLNYGSQTVPNYIRRDNTRDNPIQDAQATLGRVLFYDPALSVNRTIACASCHQQSLAFGDDAIASTGVAGTTGRHSMRLINARFSDEERFFWDERANTLEMQTTMPIQDHIEMGFSGENGDPSLDDLLDRLNGTDYYQELFAAAFGSAEVTEPRMQEALAQFIRSIQSFDTKYDAGRAQVANDNTPFPNFTALENQGKQLFMGRPQFAQGGNRVGGGLGCNACHQAPEFSIDQRSRNNGVIGALTGDGFDLNVTRSPSLRDVFLPDGRDNGPFMHTGAFATVNAVLSHYNEIPDVNQNLDGRLRPGGSLQRLNLTAQEREAVIAFLRTLTSNEVYTDERWSDPF